MVTSPSPLSEGFVTKTYLGRRILQTIVFNGRDVEKSIHKPGAIKNSAMQNIAHREMMPIVHCKKQLNFPKYPTTNFNLLSARTARLLTYAIGGSVRKGDRKSTRLNSSH